MANLKDLIVNGSARILGTIYGNLTGNATTATTATKIKVTDHASNDATYYPVWVTGVGDNRDPYATTAKLKFNPSTGVLTSTSFAGNLTGNVTGTATKATQDGSGNVITSTYATKTELGGKQATLVSGTNIKTVCCQSLLGSGDLTASSIYQNSNNVTDTIVLQDNVNFYYRGVTGNITFTFDTSQLTYAGADTFNKRVTFELHLYMEQAASITFPSNVVWINGIAPSAAFTQYKSYYLVFRNLDNGVDKFNKWVGSLQGSV